MEPTINKVGTCWFWQIFKIRELQKKHGFDKWFYLGMHRFEFDGYGNQTYSAIVYIDVKPWPSYRTLRHEKGHIRVMEGCRTCEEASAIRDRFDNETWHGFLQLIGLRSWEHTLE